MPKHQWENMVTAESKTGFESGMKRQIANGKITMDDLKKATTFKTVGGQSKVSVSGKSIIIDKGISTFFGLKIFHS